MSWNISDNDVRDIFYKSKTWKFIEASLRAKREYVDKSWKKVEQIDMFISPDKFVDILADDIKNKTYSKMADDYWNLVVGETGSAKSSLDIALYVELKNKLDDNVNVYRDFLRFQAEYIARTNLRLFETMYDIVEKKIKPDCIVLDEAHNIFDVYTATSSSLTKDILKRAFEIREWRIIHLLNSQLPHQIAKRILQGKITNLILTYFEEYREGHPLYNLYKEYWEFLEGSNVKDATGKMLFACFYKKDKTRKVLNILLKHESVINAKKVLAMVRPDLITTHMFIFHKYKDVYRIYKEIKAFQELVNAFMQQYDMHRTKLSVIVFLVLYNLHTYGIVSQDNKFVYLYKPIKLDFLKKNHIDELKGIKAFKVWGDCITAVSKSLYNIQSKFSELLEKRKKLYLYLMPEIFD